MEWSLLVMDNNGCGFCGAEVFNPARVVVLTESNGGKLLNNTAYAVCVECLINKGVNPEKE